MPWIEGDKDNASKYAMQFYSEVTDSDIEFLLEKRKETIAYREQLLTWQNESAALIKNPDTKEYGITMARFFGDQAKEELKYYRGICYVLYRLASNPPGDCTDNISKELSAYADQIFRQLLYRD